MTDQKRRVMLVDDEEEFRNLLANILTEAGFTVQTAGSGEQAFKLLMQNYQAGGPPSVDILITDCRMPAWDGFELLSQVRFAGLDRLPVLMISGALSHDEIESAGLLQPVGILIKPFKKELMLQKIDQMLPP